MRYLEVAPSPGLSRFVDRLWALELPDGVAAVDPILPDGHAEIIVHCGRPFAEVAPDGSARAQGRVLCAGQLSRAVRLSPQGGALVIGATLQPHGASALLGVPQHELTDRIVDLAVVNRRLARLVSDDVAGCDTAEAGLAALARALERAARPDAIHPVAERAIGIVRTRRALVGVGELANALDLSARQIERVFRDEVGLSPKTFLRISRFQSVLRTLREGAGESWAETALRHGFYDQAHFGNDFKAFTGESPSDWNVTDASLTAVFSAIRRRPIDDRRR